MNRRAWLITGGVLALAIVTTGVVRYHSRWETKLPAGKASASAAPVEETRPAGGQRITVEVLNATRVRGLARRASITLRDHGFDVVSTGTNPDQFDSTQVLARTGHKEWAALAAKAMGGGAVLMRPDSSRDVDLTVLIGASWHPPAQPFYP
ncbi:MAG: LytR C-terminal domain-containing protein [Gemmatimonadales bacterium]